MPVCRYLVVPFPINPLAVKSPLTKLLFVQGWLPPTAFNCGVIEAIKLSEAKASHASILASKLSVTRPHWKVEIADLLASEGAVPPFVTTWLAQLFASVAPEAHPPKIVF